MVKLFPQDLVRDRISSTLMKTGVVEDAADWTASVLVDADIRGHHSHGVELLPTYLARIKAGGIRPEAYPAWVKSDGAVRILDAQGGLGPIAAREAAIECTRTASNFGIAAVGIYNGNHIGMLAAYREFYVNQNIVGLIFNISGPSVAPPEGQRPTLGNNAVCLIAPMGNADPFVIDFATGIVASGKIRHAHSQGSSVPSEWLLDPQGQPSSDPSLIDKGGSVPVFGGHKGLCVSLIIEIMAGALVGGRGSSRVHKQRAEPESCMKCSQLFLGFCPSIFPFSEIPEVVTELRLAVSSAYDDLVPNFIFPEEQEKEATVRHSNTGIPLTPELIKILEII